MPIIRTRTRRGLVSQASFDNRVRQIPSLPSFLPPKEKLKTLQKLKFPPFNRQFARISRAYIYIYFRPRLRKRFANRVILPGGYKYNPRHSSSRRLIVPKLQESNVAGRNVENFERRIRIAQAPATGQANRYTRNFVSEAR